MRERDGRHPLQRGHERDRERRERHHGQHDVEGAERLPAGARAGIVAVPGQEQRHEQHQPRDAGDPLARAQSSQIHAAGAYRRRGDPGAAVPGGGTYRGRTAGLRRYVRGGRAPPCSLGGFGGGPTGPHGAELCVLQPPRSRSSRQGGIPAKDGGAGRTSRLVEGDQAPRARAAFRVFTSSIARVIGPTPPGTGVMAAARSFAAAKSTSPTRPSFVRFVPTSITTAPSPTMSPVTSPAEPAAATSTSAPRHTPARSRVRE